MAKRAPAIYPKPEPVRLKEPVRLLGVDVASRTVTVQHPQNTDDRQAIEQAVQTVRERWDLFDRLRGYRAVLVERLGGYAGVSAEMPFAEVKQRLAESVKPEDTDAAQRDAWLSLRTLAILDDCLQQIREVPAVISVALCAAMDLGQLLQRQQVQIDVGEHVDVGRRNSAGRVKASAKRKASCDAEREAAFQEYLRLRKAGGRTKHHTATLQNMAKAAKGELSFGTLKRWATADDWNQKYLTSSK